MNRKLFAGTLAVAVAFVLPAAGSAGHTVATCRGRFQNQYAHFCVYFVGSGPLRAHSKYVVTMHFLNDGSQPLRGQANVLVTAVDGTKFVPAGIRLPSGIQYRTGNWMGYNGKVAGRLLGLPGGLAPHQDVAVRLTFSVQAIAQGINCDGLFVLAQWWVGGWPTPSKPLGVNVKKGGNQFCPSK